MGPSSGAIGVSPAGGPGGQGKFPADPRAKLGNAPPSERIGKPLLLRGDGTGQNEILEPFP